MLLFLKATYDLQSSQPFVTFFVKPPVLGVVFNKFVSRI